ncbi:MAG: 16S rRNA processing protein RimM [Acidobacteria bacterium]|nr:16S rRNA processing protein RimM [Acidobacteriota bacterium]
MGSQQRPFDVNPTSPAEPELFGIARITRTRGLRGEVSAEILTDYPDRFADVRDVYWQLPGGQLLILQLEEYWFHQGRLILKFVGYDTIDQAQQLVGGIVKIRQEDLVELETDEFFHFQLIDCEVVTTSGTLVGRVVNVMETTGTPLLIVRDDQGHERLIPFANTICPEVDIEAKRIRIDPPEGLLEL